MKHVKSVLITLLLAVFAVNVNATTFFPSKVDDPFSNGKMTIQEIVSYGTYIYQWDSKYDMVFWPYISEEWIAFSPKSGFICFSGEHEVTDEEKAILAHWLEQNYDKKNKPKNHVEKLIWLLEVTKARGSADDYWIRYLNRLITHIAAKAGEKDIAVEYLKKSLKLHEEYEKTIDYEAGYVEPSIFDHLYIMGEYNRRLGNNEAAKGFFKRVKNLKYKDEEGNIYECNIRQKELVWEREKSLGVDVADEKEKAYAKAETDKKEREKKKAEEKRKKAANKPPDDEWQKTFKIMREIAMQVANYDIDYNFCPKAKDIHKLKKILDDPDYYVNMPTKDAWGNDLHYRVVPDEHNPGRKTWELGSAGPDGVYHNDLSYVMSSEDVKTENCDILIRFVSFIYGECK